MTEVAIVVRLDAHHYFFCEDDMQDSQVVRSRWSFVAAFGAIALSACSDDALPTETHAPKGLPPLTTQAAVAAVDSQSQTGRDPEAVPTRLALAIPGFGGFGFDAASGQLVILLKDVARANAATGMVRGYLVANYRGIGGKAGPQPPVRVERASFDYLELGSIRDRIKSTLYNEPGAATHRNPRSREPR